MRPPESADAADRVSARKLEHLEISMHGSVDGPIAAGWDDITLVHNCLPEIDLDDVDLTTPFMGYMLKAPVWITGMTGGHPDASRINASLAAAAERHGIAMGVGSQRAAMLDERLAESYRSARESAPNAVLVANIGVPQLLQQSDTAPLSLDDLTFLIDLIGAQALAVHLNWTQEMMQVEGDRRARGGLDAIAGVVRASPVPVMVKETGAGIAREQANALARVGVQAIDVGGSGGTSMVRVEMLRDELHHNGRVDLAGTFDGWGIPTAASVLETRESGVPIIATGGVRTGLDAARAFSIGASLVGVGRPFLLAAVEGEDALDRAIEQFIIEMRVALFLSGCPHPADLVGKSVVSGRTRGWCEARGLQWSTVH